MKFTSFIIPAFYAACATALPTSNSPLKRDTDGAFTAIALRSGSPIHQLALNAAGSSFWLGGQPGTYCPTTVVNDCPPGNITVFSNAYDLVSPYLSPL